MKRFTAKILCLFLLAAGLMFPARAVDHNELEEASVRLMSEDGSGSGFIINSAGNIVTNEHVVRGGGRLLVFHRAKGRTKVYLAEVVDAAADIDLAIVQVKALRSPIQLKINLADPARLQEAMSMGYPGITDSQSADFGGVGATLKTATDDEKRAGVDITEALAADPKAADFVNATMTAGTVQRLSKQVLVKDGRDVSMVEHNLNIQHGNSGGPLLDRGGNVIGVVGRGQENRADNDRALWAISASELITYLKRFSISFETVNVTAADLETKPTILGVTKPVLSREHLILVSVAGASALVAMSLGLAVLLRRAKRVPEVSQTVIDRAISRAFRIKRGGQGSVPIPEVPANPNVARAVPVAAVPPLPAPAAPPLSTARTSHATWELQCEWPNGERKVLRLTEEIFRQARGRPIVGRKADFCHLVIEHDSISRQHLHFRLDGTQLVIADRHSSNGTSVNGHAVEAAFRETPVRDGDLLLLGEIRVLLRRGF